MNPLNALRRVGSILGGPATEIYQVARFFKFALVCAAVVLLTLGFGKYGFKGTAVTFFAICSIIFLAGSFSGALAGFLFGVPRYRKPEFSEGDKRKGVAGYTGNTNLDEISDWLTKIIVGVGLTQLENIPHWLWSKSGQIANGLFEAGFAGSAGQSITLVLIIFSTVWGFLFSFIVTKIYLPIAFSLVEDDLRSREQRAFEKITDSIRDIPISSGPQAAPTVSEAQRQNVNALQAAVEPDRLKTADDFRVFGKALYLDRKFDRALGAYEQAIEREPTNYRVLHEYAIVLSNSGRHEDAVSVLRRAKQLAHQNADSFEDQIDEAMIFALLYVPGGYKEAINLGEQLKERNSARLKQARLWVWLAAAYGQQYQAIKSTSTAEEKSTVRANALNAVRTALQLNSKWKPVLQGIWNPDLPGFNAREDDLVDFYKDPEFAKLLN